MDVTATPTSRHHDVDPATIVATVSLMLCGRVTPTRVSQVENCAAPDVADAYPAAVADAIAHQLPCDFVENVKVTLPLDDVVPVPVATGDPLHEPDDVISPL